MLTHRKQFFITKLSVSIPDFLSYPLCDGWVLYYHKALSVILSGNAVLLGNAWPVLENSFTPEEVIYEHPDSIPEEEKGWCGRYVLIYNGVVYMDACGLLGVYYCENGVSSDFALLAHSLGKEAPSYYTDNPIMNWMPAPHTPCRAIRRLLPSAAYDFVNGRVIPTPLLNRPDKEPKTEDEYIRVFTSLFCSSLTNLSNTFPGRKILIPVTGSFASRAVLAMAHHAHIEADCFIFEHDKMDSSDYAYPPELCERIDMPFFFINRDITLFDKEKLFNCEHLTAGMCRSEDAAFYSCGQYDELEKRYGNVIILRNGLWDIASDYYSRFIRNGSSVADILDNLEVRLHSPEQSSVYEYLNWINANPEPGLSPADRFYWEQNVGVGISVEEQGLDLLEHSLSFQPLNNRILITLLLGLSSAGGNSENCQARLIDFACPEIAGVPYRKHALYGNGREFIHTVTRRIKRIGLDRTIHSLRASVKKIM